MILHRTTVWLGLAVAVFTSGVEAQEDNAWPVWVGQAGADGATESWTALGPLLFREPAPAGGSVTGFRPIYLRRTASTGEVTEATVLYPLFYYRSYGDTYEWSIVNLINRYDRKDGAAPAPNGEGRTFDVWPFYFSRETGDPATTYHGLMPIAGSFNGHLGYDRISWLLFPLYARTEKHDAAVTYTPWPIVRVSAGAESGFAVWPLFGRTERTGAFQREYFLWPLIWHNVVQPGPDEKPGAAPTRQTGFLPFYSSEVGPAVTNENFLWPFFGYTDRSAPYRYHETRYLWPLLVQGRGDDHWVDRWGPFYTHSIVKGVDKTWVLWPLVRRARWIDGGIVQVKTQFFYFLYSKWEQRSVAHPAAAPAAKVHVWPLVSFWDNGAGRRQVQVPSPLEVFFPDNENMRQNWTPLFALFRYDQRAPGDVRTSLLWNAVTWTRRPREGRAEFHFGPLLSVVRRPEERRIAFGHGLFGWKRGPDGGGWHLFWMEFPAGNPKVRSAAR